MYKYMYYSFSFFAIPCAVLIEEKMKYMGINNIYVECSRYVSLTLGYDYVVFVFLTSFLYI